MEAKQTHFHWQGVDTKTKKTNDAIPTKYEKSFTSIFFRGTRKINKKSLHQFTNHLITLMKAGLNFHQALSIITDSTHHPGLRQLLSDINQQMIDGESITTLFSRYPQYFDAIGFSLIKAGELSGTLIEHLEQWASHQARQLSLKKQIIKALSYPLTVLIVALGITISLLIFIIPQFQILFQNAHQSLPLITRDIIYLSQCIRDHGAIITAAGTGTLIFLMIYFRRPSPSMYRIRSQLFKTPLFRGMATDYLLAHWTQVLSTTSRAGIPLLPALNIANQTVQNPIIRQTLSQLNERIRQGSSFHQALQERSLFPATYIQMINIAENAGTLCQMLDSLAKEHLEKFENKLFHLSKLVEPVIMILLALITGSLIIAMYLPIFKMGALF